MSDGLSFVEIEGQHVELLPTRTVLSIVGGGNGSDGSGTDGSDGSDGNGTDGSDGGVGANGANHSGGVAATILGVPFHFPHG